MINNRKTIFEQYKYNLLPSVKMAQSWYSIQRAKINQTHNITAKTVYESAKIISPIIMP